MPLKVNRVKEVLSETSATLMVGGRSAMLRRRYRTESMTPTDSDSGYRA